jgi:hypothetical protein
MKDSIPILYSNDAVAEAVTTYSEARSLDLPKWLTDYHADVCANNTNSNLMISTYQAKSLVWLARLIEAKRGMYIFSYSCHYFHLLLGCITLNMISIYAQSSSILPNSTLVRSS